MIHQVAAAFTLGKGFANHDMPRAICTCGYIDTVVDIHLHIEKHDTITRTE